VCLPTLSRYSPAGCRLYLRMRLRCLSDSKNILAKILNATIALIDLLLRLFCLFRFRVASLNRHVSNVCCLTLFEDNSVFRQESTIRSPSDRSSPRKLPQSTGFFSSYQSRVQNRSETKSFSKVGFEVGLRQQVFSK